MENNLTGNVKIKITKHWNSPPEKGFAINDEFMVTLHLCQSPQAEYYAILDSGKIIPNGCFSTADAPITSVGKSPIQLAIEGIESQAKDYEKRGNEDKNEFLLAKSEALYDSLNYLRSFL